MGITGLWGIIRPAGEIIHIADYAARHFEQHKRPLRIAVDECCWRFTNLTDEQVQKILRDEPAAHPVKKTILWRILRLLRLNIQLIFVNDGWHRPKKRGNNGPNQITGAKTKVLHQLLAHLKIPFHQAPAEAEAECAALQKLGVVDAVWSDDGDAFMFGATTLIKAHKVGKERVKDKVEVFTANRLLEKFDFDADSFMLFALLSGGDYDIKGLVGCGPETAKTASKTEWKVATAARSVQQHTLNDWRQALRLALRAAGSSVNVPDSFPDMKALENYRNPKISTTEQLTDLRRLRAGWDVPLDQKKLRGFLFDYYHFETREFIKHIIPLYLAKALISATPDQRVQNLKWEVQLKRTVKRKVTDGEEAPAKAERKFTFLPGPAVGIDLSDRVGENWSKWDGKDGVPYDPLQRIECELPLCFLVYGLPEGSLDTAPPPARKKRKAAKDGSESPSPKKAKLKKPRKSDGTASVAIASLSKPTAEARKNKANDEADPVIASSSPRSKAPPHSRKSDTNDTAAKRPRRKKDKVDGPSQEAPAPAPASFKRPNIPAALSALGHQPEQNFNYRMGEDERLARQLQHEELIQAGGLPRCTDVIKLGENTEDDEPVAAGHLNDDERLARQLQREEDMQALDQRNLIRFGRPDSDIFTDLEDERSNNDDELLGSPLFVTPARNRDKSHANIEPFEESPFGSPDRTQAALELSTNDVARTSEVPPPQVQHDEWFGMITDRFGWDDAAHTQAAKPPLASEDHIGTGSTGALARLREVSPSHMRQDELISTLRSLKSQMAATSTETQQATPTARPLAIEEPGDMVEAGLIPGEAIPSAKLRELRAAAFSRKGPAESPAPVASESKQQGLRSTRPLQTLSSNAAGPPRSGLPPRKPPPEIIDLT